MDLKLQHEIQRHFEAMYQHGQKPWRYHPPEKSLQEFFKKVEKELGKAKILDIGCGDGWISLEVAGRGHEVWGLDSSKTAIEEAKTSAQKVKLPTKVHFQVANALNLPYGNNSFDAAIDRGLFHHIIPQNRTLYLKNLLRVVRKKSLLYLSVFSEDNPIGIGQLFTKEKIKQIFGNYFSTVYFDEDPYPSQAPAHLLHFILKRKR